MMMRCWIRKLFARPVVHPFRKRPFRARPALEALEQRTVPSFTVTNTLDDGSVGSLRWAVGQANMTGGDETIDFDPIVFATPQTITLSGTQLELTDTTGTETITGPAVGVTVDGGGLSRVFQIDGGVTASISGLTISGGHTTGNGGGLSNLGGTLTLTDCTVSGNSAVYVGGLSGLGGGVFGSSGSTTTLTDCTVSGNSAARGGGVDNDGRMNLTDCTVSGNSAEFFGGGVESFGATPLTNCTLRGNSAGYWGGGLFALYGETLTNCTVSGNSAGYGGGLVSYYGGISLTNCTVSGNSGGGLADGGAGLHNTVIAGNVRRDVSGRVNPASDYNLIGDGTGMTGISNGVNGNQVGTADNPIDPLLGPLQDNGGPTQTQALLPGSPAIDAGNNAYATDWDQRGEGFPRIVGILDPDNPVIDIGAFEVQAASGPHGRPFARGHTTSAMEDLPPLTLRTHEAYVPWADRSAIAHITSRAVSLPAQPEDAATPQRHVLAVAVGPLASAVWAPGKLAHRNLLDLAFAGLEAGALRDVWLLDRAGCRLYIGFGAAPRR